MAIATCKENICPLFGQKKIIIRAFFTMKSLMLVDSDGVGDNYYHINRYLNFLNVRTLSLPKCINIGAGQEYCSSPTIL